MKKIDLENWNRKEIFDFFSGISNPIYMVTFEVDVTNLYSYVKKNNLSFYYSLVFLCTKAMNQIDNFLYTIKNNEIYQFESRNPSFTDIKKDSELFQIVTMDMEKDIIMFNEKAKINTLNQTCFIDYSLEDENLIYFSCLPWVYLTAITNENDIKSSNFKDDSIPHITWGKYIENGNQKKLNMSLQVNHRFVDGIHIGKFNQILESEIKKLK